MQEANPAHAVEGTPHDDGDQSIDAGEAGEERRGSVPGPGRDIPARKPARARQKALKRCSVM